MDPVTGLAVAGNAVQFFDVSLRAIKLMREAYASKDGLLNYQQTLGEEIARFDILSGQIKRQCSSNAELEQLRLTCEALSSDIAIKLNDIKPKQSSKKAVTIAKHLFFGDKHKRELQNLQQKLEQGKSDLRDRILLEVLVQSHLIPDALEAKEVADKVFEELAKGNNHVLKQIIETEGERTRQAVKAAGDAQSQALFNEKFLQSLSFAEMHDRHQAIEEAHTNTLRWVFRDTYFDDINSDHDMQNLEARQLHRRWLQQDDASIFWVQGKPGSGKSTLMAYLTDWPGQLQQLLSDRWCAGKIVVLASFFAKLHGTELQRNITGLLRSIAHKLLANDRSLLMSSAGDYESGPPSPWRRSQLITLVDSLLRASKSPILLMIDALDELRESRDQIVSFLKVIQDWTRLDHVRAIVSSRPEVPFTNHLGHLPSVRLQDLNSGDIRHYVRSDLGNLELDSLLLWRFESTIIDKSEGVFLWVKLVVRSLIEGFENGDSVAILQKRLDAVPPDLSNMLDQMLSQIQPDYVKDAAFLFQLPSAALPQPADLRLCSWNHWTWPTGGYPGFLMDEACAYFTYADDFDFASYSGNHIKTHITNKYRQHVSARCQGLLEVKSDHHVLRVDFVHRTAKEHLATSSLGQRILSKKLSEAEFASAFARGLCNWRRLVPTDKDAAARLIYWAACSDAALEKESVSVLPFYDQGDDDRLSSICTEAWSKKTELILGVANHATYYFPLALDGPLEYQPIKPNFALTCIAAVVGIWSIVEEALSKYPSVLQQLLVEKIMCTLRATSAFYEGNLPQHMYEGRQRIISGLITAEINGKETILREWASIVAREVLTDAMLYRKKHQRPNTEERFGLQEIIKSGVGLNHREIVIPEIGLDFVQRELYNRPGGGLHGQPVRKTARIGYHIRLAPFFDLCHVSATSQPTFAIDFSRQIRPLFLFIPHEPWQQWWEISKREARKHPVRFIYLNHELSMLMMIEIAQTWPRPGSWYKWMADRNGVKHSNLTHHTDSDEDEESFPPDSYCSKVLLHLLGMFDWDNVVRWLDMQDDELISSRPYEVQVDDDSTFQECDEAAVLLYDREAAARVVRNVPGFEEYCPKTWHADLYSK